MRLLPASGPRVGKHMCCLLGIYVFISTAISPHTHIFAQQYLCIITGEAGGRRQGNGKDRILGH